MKCIRRNCKDGQIWFTPPGEPDQKTDCPTCGGTGEINYAEAAVERSRYKIMKVT